MKQAAKDKKKKDHEEEEDEDGERKVHSFHTETDSCEACSDPDCQGCDEDEEEVVAESYTSAYLERIE